MKTKHFLTAIFAASLVLLVGCNTQENVNVEDLAEQLGASSFEKTVTRSKTVVDGLSMQIVEWTIVDAEKHQIAPFGFVFGDGVQEEWPAVVYNYEQGELAEDGLGIEYKFTPLGTGEALNVLYWGNALIIHTDTIADASAPIANLKKIAESFSNSDWDFVDKELCILFDTISYIDTVITVVRRPDPVTGKPVFVNDTTIEKVTKVLADTIGNLRVTNKSYFFSRDAESFENKAIATFSETTFKLNEEKRTLEQDTHTEYVKHYHWGISSITSAKRFVVDVVDDETKEKGQLRMSAFDAAKGVITIGNDEFKAAEIK